MNYQLNSDLHYHFREKDTHVVAMDLPSEPAPSIAFGCFQVLPHRRELLADGQPINLGGRAFDVLMALIEARGTVISKGALTRHVWPDRIVDENTLQVQISALRAALGPERELIRTVSGRGYQFAGEIRSLSTDPYEHAGVGVAAPVSWVVEGAPPDAAAAIARAVAWMLPPRAIQIF